MTRDASRTNAVYAHTVRNRDQLQIPTRTRTPPQSAPEGIRTPNLLIRSQNRLLQRVSAYPIGSEEDHLGGGNRLVVSHREAASVTRVVTPS